MFKFCLRSQNKNISTFTNKLANYCKYGSNSIAVAVLRGTFALAPTGRPVPTAGTPQPGTAKEQFHRKPGKGQEKEKKNQKENFHDNHESGGRA
jgi:hypothetical protein